MATDNLSEAADFPICPQYLPTTILRSHGYRVHFARSVDDVRAVQRLRFEVFNLEMGEGLEESYATGLDVDRFDTVCHHLMVIHEASGAVVGTYRMQTSEMAAEFHGFYSADEFDLSGFPSSVIDQSIEVGRACIAKPYRNRSVLFLLWRGLALFMIHNAKRYLFGCCSLTSQDPIEGRHVMEHLRRTGGVHPEYVVRPRPDWRCYESDLIVDADRLAQPVDLPRLFGVYMRYGAKVCGEPALDRQFKTIDYLVLLDLNAMDEHSHAMFFSRLDG